MAAPTTDRPTVRDVPRPTAPTESATDEPFLGGDSALAGDAGPGARPSEPEPTIEVEAAGPIPLRPLLAAGLATAAAALVTGGIFGTWSARLIALFAAAFGVFWAWLTLRARGKETTYQLLLLPVSLVVGLILLIPAGGGGPSALPQLVREAVSSGRLLRPPVPFDPGWRPILMIVFSLLGFAAAWVATALDRQRLSIAVPLPILALTAITQPDDGEFIAGLCAFVPLIGALAVLFGGDSLKASELTKAFELKRALRGLVATVAAVVALVVLSNASFLFPEPVYDPSDQPQKPRPIPLSSIEDRVLFEVKTDSPITGPWKTGVLDVYDGESWKLPPFDKTRFVEVPAGGVVNESLLVKATQEITFIVRDLGDSGALPGTTTATKIAKADDLGAKYDPRAEVFRMPEGRVPADSVYTISLPPYPQAADLLKAPAPVGDFAITTEMPEPPEVVKTLLDAAPAEPPWARLDFMRKRLRQLVVAVGGGVPKDITPERVAEILEDPKHEASPYEIVAAETMLSRWAGVPARIGFGFDGVNDEDGVMTVRPANAAQWLEVYFEGFGWVPLIEAPEQAKQQLDNDPNAKFDPNTVASDEVALEILIPIKLESLRLLYERIREQLVAALPFVLLAVAAYLSTPTVMKTWRRRKRRQWAEKLGPRAQIAVEYAEFRDLAHDLNVGDPLDTPLEYLKRVVDDDEHAEFAWLVSRAMYGDLASSVSDVDAGAAEELSSSLRRRMFRGQPLQARMLATVSKASLRDPYTDEVPTVILLDPLGRFASWRRARAAARKASRRGSRVTSWLRLPRIALAGRRP